MGKDGVINYVTKTEVFLCEILFIEAKNMFEYRE